MNSRFLLLPIVIVLFNCSSIFSAELRKEQKKGQKNILFIMVDDLRNQLGCYGHSEIKSPNIDKLASEGIAFSNAYCNFPVCGPSRASIFSGLRPNKTRFINNSASIEREAPGILSMPDFFIQNGYTAISLGKIYHPGPDGKGNWSVKPWSPNDNNKYKKICGWRDYLTKENFEICKTNVKKIGNSYEMADVDDYQYNDGRLALKAIDYLKKFKSTGETFFLAVGFVKPHLPFNAPKKYFDMYPEKSISLAENNFWPKNTPQNANHNWFELRAYKDIPDEGPLTEEMAKKLIRGYNACVSYSDAMVGKVLNSLEGLGLADNTIVVLIGDHGWHLGEHTMWAKHANFNMVINAPLIIKIPGSNITGKTKSLAEFVDLYPTLCDLTGNKAPDHLEGKSLVKVLQNPKRRNKVKAVYSKYSNGYTVITQNYNYTMWLDDNNKQQAHMLFDKQSDAAENVNVADNPKFRSVVKKHQKLLMKYINNDLR